MLQVVAERFLAQVPYGDVLEVAEPQRRSWLGGNSKVSETMRQGIARGVRANPLRGADGEPMSGRRPFGSERPYRRRAPAWRRTTEDHPGPEDNRAGHRFLALMGGRFTRDTIIYVIGSLAVGPFSLVSVVVLTRLMAPAEYGELAVMLFLAGYLTTVYNTGSLHGTFLLVYGASEGEGDDVDSDATITSTPRRALGTGVLLTLMIVSVGTALCCAFAPTLARLLVDRSSEAALVRWAAVSAGAGALWRLTMNIFRMERQPTRFAAFNALPPLSW